MSQFFSKPVQNTAINWHKFNPPDRFEYNNYVAGSLEMFHCSGSLAKPQFSKSIAVITTHGLGYDGNSPWGRQPLDAGWVLKMGRW